MPNINIVKTHTIKSSFRVDAIRGLFDFSYQTVKHEMKIRVPLEDRDWKIGLIVGGSGTGKTTIANELFPDQVHERATDWDNSKSFVDSFDAHIDIKDIIAVLSSIGLASPPDWMKPFSILSNGQQFRVDLARKLLETEGTLVFDEFTSVVDRQVAKSCCNSLHKYLTRKEESPRFVAVTCHHDVVAYLRPDWVLNLDTQQFTWCGRLPKPRFNFIVRQCSGSVWELFRKHHYLSHNIATSCKCFCAFVVDENGNETPIGFTSYIRQPHNIVTNLMREHRTVVLPDYQGLGIGVALSDWLAHKIVNTVNEKEPHKGWRYTSVTSHPAMIHYRLKSPDWKCIRRGSICTSGTSKAQINTQKRMNDNYRYTYTFEYIGHKGERAEQPKRWSRTESICTRMQTRRRKKV